MTSRLLSPARLAVLFAVLVSSPLLLSFGHAAAATPEATKIAVTAPATAVLGEQVTAEARLSGSAGPIAKATVLFAVPTTFDNTTADMIVGTAVTDASGVATVDFAVRMTGSLQVKAIFAGNDAYAASSATSALSVSGNEQLYKPDNGIRVRGLTAAPIGPDSGVGHWLLTGWPIAALLIVIWSAYAAAVFFMSRISAEGNHSVEAGR